MSDSISADKVDKAALERAIVRCAIVLERKRHEFVKPYEAHDLAAEEKALDAAVQVYNALLIASALPE